MKKTKAVSILLMLILILSTFTFAFADDEVSASQNNGKMIIEVERDINDHVKLVNVSLENVNIDENNPTQVSQWQSHKNNSTITPQVGGWPDVATFINKVDWTGDYLTLNFRCRPNKPIKRWIGDASIWSMDGTMLSYWDLNLRDPAGTMRLEDQFSVYTGANNKVRLEVVDQYVYAVDGDRASLTDTNMTFKR